MKNATHSGTLLFRLFPFLTWFSHYSGNDFRNDALAGVTVAVVLIPQSMAYAMLAGLPPVYGLYAATLSPMIAALWGSLRQLSTGPIAIMSLLVLTTLTPFAEPGSPEYISLSFIFSAMVGALYLLLGLLRMGIVMAFISHSSVKGFTAAAALIIISTQIPHFLGISVGRHEFIFPMLVNIVQEVPRLNPVTTVIGIISFCLIYAIKRMHKTLPAGLIALTLATGAVMIFDLDQYGVAIVGRVTPGLPRFQIPPVSFRWLSELAGPTVVIALVSFAETYSVGKVISGETGQKLSVDQELIGQGIANFIGSFFQSYPVSGSFSRSAINFAAGAGTGVSSIISGLIVITSLLFLTPLFTFIPKAALAALVISAVLLLFHPGEVFVLLKKNRHDGIVAVTVFVMGLVIKPDYALLIGVMLSMMYFLWKTMHPRIVRVTKDPELNMFVDGDARDRPSCPQILHLRIDSEIYFGNAEFLTDHLLQYIEETASPLKFLVLDFQAVGYIDITGMDELKVLKDEIGNRNIELAFMTVHRPVREVFKTAGFEKEIRPERIFSKRGEAVSALFSEIDHDYCRKHCPSAIFDECGKVK